MTQGFTWKTHNITYEMVIQANRHIEEGSTELWQFALGLLDESVKKGYLARQ